MCALSTHLRAHEKAAADCSLSSEPRKYVIFPSAKRNQCCMCIAARLPVALTVYSHHTATITSVSFAVNDSGENPEISTFDAISLKNCGTSDLPRNDPYHGTDVLAASAAQSTSSLSSASTASMSPRK